MNLFINAVSRDASFILFDNNRQIVSRLDTHVAGNESSKLTHIIDNFFRENKCNYSRIENIVVVNGPGSFTGVRAICLLVNTINFINKKCITPISFFHLFDGYPIVKTSSKRDVFIKKSSTSEVMIIKNEELGNYFEKNNITEAYGELPISQFEGSVKLFDKIDYNSIIQELEFKDFIKVDPLYIKKPNIS